MREIGGYMGLEDFRGEEYYSDLTRVNLGRTALLWLLEARGYRKLLLPFYLCSSVTESCRKAGISLEFYRISRDLSPILSRQLQEGEALYLVNYYGQLTDQKILEYQKAYGRIIVDHTHSFYQRPLPGVDTLYSCRKFFGVSDGAYLSTDARLPQKERDISMDHMAHVLGRYETDAGSWYQAMLDNARSYETAPILTMSRLTENLMRAVDYPRVKAARERNYRTLKELLPCSHPCQRTVPEAPFAYPYYHKDGIRLRSFLAGRKIFVPTNWSNVLRDMPPDSLEYDLAANVLPLPCDQRYGQEDMESIAESIRAFEQESGTS